jgi:hypothetical protein
MKPKVKKYLSISLALFIISIRINAITAINVSNSERAFLHTDREIYIAGETVFFKLYIINETTHKLSDISRIAYLILRNRTSTPIARIRLKLDHGTTFGSIFLSDTLSSGPYQLSVFTNWMRNSGEESFFTKEIFIANRFDTDLSTLNTFSGTINNSVDSTPQSSAIIINSDKPEYNKRDKIKLALKFPDHFSRALANVSISVTEEVPGLGKDISIGAYLFMQESKSDSVKSLYPGNSGYLPEQKGEIINGNVRDQLSHAIISNSCVFLSAVDSVVNLQYCYTDANGLFRFLLNDYYDGKDLIFSIKDNPENKKYKIELEDKFELKSVFKPIKYEEYKLIKEYILKSQDILSIQKIYKPISATEIKKQFKANNICPRIYSRPYFKVNPGDYVPLNDFAELSREILPPQFKMRKQNGKYYASMADENQHLYMEHEPVVFLDGVYIDNINQIIQMGSNKIKRVDMLCCRFNYGEIVFPGILAVFSKNNEIANIQTNPTTLRVQLETYHAWSVYTAPMAVKGNPDHQPDFRQLLYWNPDIEISPQQNQVPEFYASDHSGSYIIRIEGISSEGVPISAVARFSVK